MPSYTTYYNIAKPDVNNPDDQDLWGGYINGDMDIIDSTMHTLAQGMYPVGSLYFNASDATNPATLLGFGTWTAFAAGRIPIGVGTGTDINGNTLAITNGATGGEYTHTLTTSEMPSHTHTDSGHSHTLFRDISQGVGSSYYITNGVSNYATATTSISYANIQNTGGGGAHNVTPPYIGIYIWQRTS